MKGMTEGWKDGMKEGKEKVGKKQDGGKNGRN
jgi:hypothetical protein